MQIHAFSRAQQHQTRRIVISFTMQANNVDITTGNRLLFQSK